MHGVMLINVRGHLNLRHAPWNWWNTRNLALVVSRCGENLESQKNVSDKYINVQRSTKNRQISKTKGRTDTSTGVATYCPYLKFLSIFEYRFGSKAHPCLDTR